jgi:hypothetical protein
VNTYSTLIQAIQDWAEDDDAEFLARLPDIVDLGEKRLLRDLDLALFRRQATPIVLVPAVASVTKSTISAPNLRVATKGLWVTGTGLAGPTFLELRSHEYVTMYSAGVAAAVPRYYAEQDETTWIVSPAPALAYSLHERYLSRPTRLGAGNQTNWLSTHAYDILFKACLAEALAFLKADARKVAADVDYEGALPVVRRELHNLYGNRYDGVGAVPIPQAPRTQE